MAMRCQNNKKMISRAALAASWSLVLILCGCKSSSDFSEDIAKFQIEVTPMKLEGEQVTLTDGQVQCGIQSELWDPPTTLSPDHTTAHLAPKGRDLKFADDVIIHDPGSHIPFVQIRGEFQFQVDSIVSLKDGEDKFSKLVEAKAGVKIDNPCFQNALPLMGVRHGNFSADTPVVFHMRLEDSGWHPDKIVH